MEKQKKQEINNQNKQIYAHLYPFRAVFPYDFQYQTFAKQRWFGKPLLQTLVKQFKAYQFAYYKSAIEEGKITMNGKKVAIDYIIKNGDKLTHSAVRQEPPILDLKIQIIDDNEDYLVVNKPPSFTVHTGGGFHYNTLSSILQIQKGYKNLFVLHRLDRLTSGLIIYGKSKQKPQIFHKQNQNEQMKKMYFARVNGNFAWDQKTLCAEIQCVSHKDGIYKVTREIQQKQQQQKNEQNQIQGQNIDCLENESKKDKKERKKKNKLKQGQNPDLKDSKTKFRKVFYDKETDSSLIECYPISGRTHQIRVHLQFLGFPILNDVVYGGRFVGNHIIKTIRNKESLFSQKKNNGQTEDNELEQNHGSKKIKCQDLVSQGQKLKTQNGTTQKQGNRVDENKEEKQRLIESEQIKKLRERIQKEWKTEEKPWQICLHSYQYKIEGKVYQTKKPYWADEHFCFKN